MSNKVTEIVHDVKVDRPENNTKRTHCK